MAGLQGLPDLQNVGFMEPAASRAIMNQVGMANQFNQLGLQQNQAALEEQTLKNLFSREQNPLLLDQQRATNEGLGLSNTIKGVEARNATALEPEAREAKRKELLKSASMSDLESLLIAAKKDLLSDDADTRKRGQLKMDSSWEEITRRNKAKYDLEKAMAAGEFRLQGIGAQQEGANYRAELAAEQKRQAAAQRAQASKQSNENYQQAATRALREAGQATDPSVQQAKMEEAQYWMQQEQNRGLVNATGKVDVGAAAGVPTVQAPVIQKPPMPARQVSGPVTGAPNQSGPNMLAGPGADDRQNIILSELARETDPNNKAALTRELQRLRYTGPLPGQQAPAAVKAQAAPGQPGRVVIYKDGKSFSVPEAQAAEAVKQGYSYQK